MDATATALLYKELDHAERQLARSIAIVQANVGDLTANPSSWANLAHDVAEGAHWAGQVKALRDAVTLAGVS